MTNELYRNTPIKLNIGTPFAAFGIFALVVAILALAGFGTFSRKQHVIGYIEPTGGVARVFPQREGVVFQVMVKVGDSVEAGQVLFVVHTAKALNGGEELEAKMAASLQSQLHHLAAQVRLENKMTLRRLVDIDAQLDANRKLLALAEQRIASAKQSLDLRQSTTRRAEQLVAKGFYAEASLDSARSDWLNAVQVVQALIENQTKLQATINQLNNQRDTIALDHENRLAQLQAQIDGIDQQLYQTAGAQSYAIKASVGGRIASLQAQVGEAALMQRALASIVPRDAQYRSVLLVPTNAIGFVKKGMQVQIGFDAFPFQKFGLYPATVAEISAAVTPPQELTGPARSLEPTYRVTAVLSTQHIRAYGHDIALQPDLTVQADLLRERRTVLQWLLDPIYALGRAL